MSGSMATGLLTVKLTPMCNKMVIGLHLTKDVFIYQGNGKHHQEENIGRKVTGRKEDVKKTAGTGINT
jgi:hypothetical protein